MNELNNITIYNQRMDKSIEDKLWFNNMVDADVYVDFGCANGNLLKTMYQMNPNKTYIGYDNNLEMINIARENCRNTHIKFMSNLNIIKNYIDVNFKNKKVCLILSSVLHEIYSYLKTYEINKILFDIDKLEPNYIVIRDMTYGFHHSLYLQKDPLTKMREEIIKYVKQINRFGNIIQIQDFEEHWGKLQTIYNITHFLLKYKYLENWDREVKENYLPKTNDMYEFLSKKYNVKYHKKYCLPYLQEQFKKDFEIDFKGYTHYNLLFELKK